MKANNNEPDTSKTGFAPEPPESEEIRKIKESIHKNELVIIVGTGVSLALTGGKIPALSWKGLIQHGLIYGENKGVITPAQVNRYQQHLESSDLDDLLIVAEFVGRKLSAPPRNLYPRWLEQIFKNLPVTNEELKQVLCAFRSANIPICTLNYDHLLEFVTGLPAITLSNPGKAAEWMRRETQGVLHLHGSWESPDTCILGILDYEATVGNDLRDLFQRSLGAFKQLLFIGCGDTFADPNFTALIRWLGEKMITAAPQHYALVTNGEIRKRSADPTWGGFVEPIGYGENRNDLPQFLLSILPSPIVPSDPPPFAPTALQRYVEAERAKHNTLQLPLISPNGRPVVVPVEKLRIDLPLIISHEHAPRGALIDSALHGRDATWIHEQMRNSHTMALLIDRGAHCEDIRRDCGIHDRLKRGSRTVILGDPGCGKSTLLEWICHFYAKKYGTDMVIQAAPEEAPELPEQPWLPLLIRCREWNSRPVPDHFAELLRGHFAHLQFSVADIEFLIVEIEQLLDDGHVLLLIDGLDEFHNQETRRAFATFLSSLASRFPSSSIIVTSRVIGFQVAQEELASNFDHMVVGPLDRSGKMAFLRKWGALIGWEKVRIEQAVKLVCDKRRLAKLTDTIFLLSLVVQIQDEAPPERQLDIYRRAVELMIQRRRTENGTQVVPNELLPHLEYLAFDMRTRGVQRISENGATEIFEALRNIETNETVLFTRTTAELLHLCVNPLGLLNVVGTEVDTRGYERPMVQFFHQSFQEYFASQAMKHGRGNLSDTDVVGRLRDLLDSIEIRDREVILFGNRKFMEPVFADSWQETIRQFIADLPSTEADRAMGLLLPETETPSREARPRSVFALQCLADEPRVSDKVINRVFDAVIDNLEDADAVNSENRTLMDHSLVAIGRSVLAERFQKCLISEFIRGGGEQRMRAGLAYWKAVSFDGSKLGESEIEATLRECHSEMQSNDVPTRVTTALGLLQLFFLHDGKLGHLKPDHLNRFVEVFMEGLSRDPATIAASVWALYWFTGAPLRESGNARRNVDERQSNIIATLPPELIDRLEFLIRNNQIDDRFLPQGILLLTRDARIVPVGSQRAWLYDLALVADGIGPRRDLPDFDPSSHMGCRDLLLSLLTSPSSQRTMSAAAIALGSFGCFCSEMGNALWTTIQDTSQRSDFRDESFIYLALIGDDYARQMMETSVDTLDMEDDQFLYLRGICGLLLIDDVDLLAKRIKKALPHEDLVAYAYGLAGSRDPRGEELLIEFEADANQRIASAARNALSRKWLSPGKKYEPKGDMAKISGRILGFVEEYILSNSNLVMTYRAVDERSRDFFAYISCGREGVVKMKQDYTDQKSRAARDYGEVIYADFLKDPDEKAVEFLKKWVSENDGVIFQATKEIFDVEEAKNPEILKPSARIHSGNNENRRTHVEKFISTKGPEIHKLKAKDTTGRWAYYFVWVTPPNETMFMKAIEGDGTIDLEDFGLVVASCYGEEPNEEVRAFLKERFNFSV